MAMGQSRALSSIIYNSIAYVFKCAILGPTYTSYTFYYNFSVAFFRLLKQFHQENMGEHEKTMNESDNNYLAVLLK